MNSNPIRLSVHASSYISKRGFTEEEVKETIRIGEWKPAELQRLEAVMDFPYAKEWNGVYYATKRVRPIFVEETTEIVVVTAYTYYF